MTAPPKENDLSEESASLEAGSLNIGYAAIVRRRILFLTLVLAALLISFLSDIATGPSVFPLWDIVTGLFTPSSLGPAKSVILWDVRLPYALMAVLVGASLGLAGAEMQTVLNNPLASPFTLGLSEAAALGAGIAIVFSFSFSGLDQTYVIPLMAFAFAFAASLLIQALARKYGANTDTIILFGIAILFVCRALISLVQYVADANAVQQIVFWTMGSLARATWDKIGIVAFVFGLCAPFAFKNAWAMTALRAGEDQARSFGISVERMRLVVLFRVTLLAAVAVSFVGSIGFIGLVGPHMARMALGEDHRFFLPGSALAGALVLSLASIASKAVIPGLILPVGIVTALVGIPLFMGLVLSQRSRQ